MYANFIRMTEKPKMHKTKEQISYNMQQVKSKDTKIEVISYLKNCYTFFLTSYPSVHVSRRNTLSII